MTLAEYVETKCPGYAEFARSLGVEQTTVMRWCKGERRPSVLWANAIAILTAGEVPASSWGSEPLPSGRRRHSRKISRSAA